MSDSVSSPTESGIIAWGMRKIPEAASKKEEVAGEEERGARNSSGATSAAPSSPVSSTSTGFRLHSALAGDSDLSSELSHLEREERRRTERGVIEEQIAEEMSRQQRRRLNFFVRRRRTELLGSMKSSSSRRPPPGRSCYFTEGHVEDEQRRDVNDEPSPYWMPPANEELCYRTVNDQWRREAVNRERKAPFHQHYNTRTRNNLDLLRRLHLPRDALDPTTITPGILDIDPDYFSIIEGRPEDAASLGRLDVRKYLDDMRRVLVTKLMIGYSEDHCLLVEEQYCQEMKVIKRVQEEHRKNVKAFEAFLAEDHEKSMKILHKAETMASESQQMETELKSLNRVLGRVRNEVVVLQGKWSYLKNLQRFLYAASPRGWRLTFDYEYIRDTLGRGSISSGEEGADMLHTEEIRSDLSLTDLIETFNEEVDNQPDPQLYFRSSKDLQEVFDNITNFSMEMMLHSEQVRKPLDELFHSLQEARRIVDQDTEKLRNAVKEMKETIEWEEKRAAGLEADARRLLDGVFKDRVIDSSIIRIYVCVEDAYEVVVGPNDNNLSIVEMMREVERAYENLKSELDGMPPNVLAAVQADVCLDEKVGFLKAKVAARQLEHIRQLEVRMHNSMLPPPRPGMRPLVFRSPPFARVVAKRKTERKLSPKEKAMLIHLTDYCPGKDDPEPFLEQLRKTGMLE